MHLTALTCEAKCGAPISPLGAVVREGGKAFHTHCWLGPKLLEAARLAREGEAVKIKDLEDRLRRAATAAAMAAPPPSRATFVPGAVAALAAPLPPTLLEEWAKTAEKVISRFVVNHGPMLPQAALKSFMWKLYRTFVEEGLAVPLTDDTARPEPEKKGVSLEDWFKGK